MDTDNEMMNEGEELNREEGSDRRKQRTSGAYGHDYRQKAQSEKQEDRESETEDEEL